jgi:DNA-binding LytR/AlgR family response regulator
MDVKLFRQYLDTSQAPVFSRLVPLYLIGALVLHVISWYIYGGFSRDDHPSFWSIEEFFAVSGLKFLVFAMFSFILYQLYLRLRPRVGSVWWLIIPGLLIFVFCSAWLESLLLATMDWVRVFGGRNQVVLHLLDALFGALQIAVVAYGKATELTEDHLDAELPDEDTVSLVLKRNNYEYSIEADQISYAEAFGNFTKVIVEEETYLYGKGIGELIKELPKTGFLRIHRSYLIRTDEVARVRKKSKVVTVVLKDGTELPVGPSKKERVLAL